MPRRQLLELLWSNSIEAVISCVNLGSVGEAEGGREEGTATATACVIRTDPSLVSRRESASDSKASEQPPARSASSLVGQVLSRELHAEWLVGRADGVDECGERGEFHTMVVAAPLFRGLRLELGGGGRGSGAASEEESGSGVEIVREKDFAFLRAQGARLVSDGGPQCGDRVAAAAAADAVGAAAAADASADVEGDTASDSILRLGRDLLSEVGRHVLMGRELEAAAHAACSCRPLLHAVLGGGGAKLRLDVGRADLAW